MSKSCSYRLIICGKYSTFAVLVIRYLTLDFILFFSQLTSLLCRLINSLIPIFFNTNTYHTSTKTCIHTHTCTNTHISPHSVSPKSPPEDPSAHNLPPSRLFLLLFSSVCSYIQCICLAVCGCTFVELVGGMGGGVINRFFLSFVFLLVHLQQQRDYLCACACVCANHCSFNVTPITVSRVGLWV